MNEYIDRNRIVPNTLGEISVCQKSVGEVIVPLIPSVVKIQNIELINENQNRTFLKFIPLSLCKYFAIGSNPIAEVPCENTIPIATPYSVPPRIPDRVETV
jgi:hypothetical protein